MRLTDFLLARIAEDEAARDKARDDVGASRSESDAWSWVRHSKADCEAKRQIVMPHVEGHRCEWGDWYATGECEAKVLRHLAAIYADHPDYDEAWRVER